MRIVSPGHVAFALIMIGLGVLGLVTGHFAPIWPPVPKSLPLRQELSYLCAVVSLACGVGLFWRSTSKPASSLLFGYLLVWLLVFRFPDLFTAPDVEGSWSGWGETAVMTAAAWVLYVWFAKDQIRAPTAFAAGKTGLSLARALYGLALIPFGAAHFVYFSETTAMVPSYVPFHTAVAGLTGTAFILAGVAILVGIFARAAAALSTLQMGLFTLMVWGPVVVAAGPKSAFQWSESVLSLALTAAGWVVSDSYREMPWFAISLPWRQRLTPRHQSGI